MTMRWILSSTLPTFGGPGRPEHHSPDVPGRLRSDDSAVRSGRTAVDGEEHVPTHVVGLMWRPDPASGARALPIRPY